jgi:hypothetical protein
MFDVSTKCADCGIVLGVRPLVDPLGNVVLEVERDCDCGSYKDGYHQGMEDAQDDY